MDSQPKLLTKYQLHREKGQVRNSTLILLGFATAFFPRLLTVFGAPSPLNFVHFVVVPTAFAITIFTTKTRDRASINTVWQLLAGLFSLLLCTFISAVINKAGLVNVALQFMIQAEPFMLLAAIISLPMSPERFRQFRYWVLSFALFNLLLAIAQSILMPLGIYPRPAGGTLQDNIGGVFGGGSGSAANYISCTVSVYFGLYFFNRFKHVATWLRLLPLIGAFYQTQISDSKQVFLALAAGWGLLTLTKIEKPARLLMYFTAGITVLTIFIWVLFNVEAAILSPYQNWINRPIWGWDGLAAQTKFAAFRIIPTHFESTLNWFFGLGPGHSVTRLGGWVLRDYRSMLLPLGATIHPASGQVFDVVESGYLAQESTLYFPLFTWVGIWGDLGLIGLGGYLYLCSIVWQRICVDDFGKFLLLSTASFGCILTQMEEPGHVLSVACLLAIRWLETRPAVAQKRA